MLVIVFGQRASSYNDSPPMRLAARCIACSASQRASCNIRKTHLTLKSFATTDAACSPAQPPPLLLMHMARLQTVQLQPLVYDRQPYQMWTTPAFRLRTRVSLHACKLALHTLGTSRRHQRRRCITFYTSFSSRHAHVQRLNTKCESGTI